MEVELNKIKTAYLSLRKDALKFRNDARRSGSVARALYAKLNISRKGIQRMAEFSQKLGEIADP